MARVDGEAYCQRQHKSHRVYGDLLSRRAAAWERRAQILVDWSGRARRLNWGLLSLFGNFSFGYFGDKSIADSWHGKDVALSVLAIAKSLAQKEDVLAQVAFFHEAVRPDGLHEFRLLDDTIAVFNQEQ